jgi:uncharacterized protein (DUF58 family)
LLRSRRELARLNHIFIPEKKPDRDRLRKRWSWRLVAPAFAVHSALSEEGRALFLMSILVGFAGLDVIGTQVYLLFSAMAGLIVASLAMRPFFRAPGLSMKVASAPRVEVGAPLEIVIRLVNGGPRPLLGLKVSGPFLPWDGRWLNSRGAVAAIEPGREAAVVATATFMGRGEHHLDGFDAGALVPLGLAIGPRRHSEGVRFLVVPKIAKVGPLRLRHRRPAHLGDHARSRAPGQSEIDGVRPYRPGDALKHLHARTWARTGVPHVRTYAAENSVKVGLALVVDGDHATERTKEAAISLAAGVTARLASEAGLDLLLVDTEATVISPRAGKPALDSVLDRLAVHELTTKDTDAAAAIEERVGPLSALVLVTADSSPARRALVRDLRAQGLDVHWMVAVEEAAAAPDPADATGVTVADIEAEGAVPA